MKKKISSYCVCGWCKCCDDDHEFPDFHFETKSLKFLFEFVSTVDDDVIELEVTRFFEDGSINHIDIYKIRELLEVMKHE